MKVASIADVKARLSSYVNATSQSPVLITRNGKAVAAIVPITEEEDIERLMIGYSPKFKAIVGKARKQIENGQGIPHEQFWAAFPCEDGYNPAMKKSPSEADKEQLKKTVQAVKDVKASAKKKVGITYLGTDKRAK